MVHFDWIKRHAERTPQASLGGCPFQPGADVRATQHARQSSGQFFVETLGLRAGDRVVDPGSKLRRVLRGAVCLWQDSVILNTLNWRLAAPELEYILNDCTPRVLIYESAFAEAVEALRPNVGVEQLVVLGDSAPPGAWLRGCVGDRRSGWRAAAPAELRRHLGHPVHSGTTGQPKGAQVTYGNFFYNAVGMGRPSTCRRRM